MRVNMFGAKSNALRGKQVEHFAVGEFKLLARKRFRAQAVLVADQHELVARIAQL